ncbi:MAG TPA: O-antigen ligase family protein [Terriglobia bacterium]|nr:O-antigen ligase family protein [Terriglobia bacterium]
MFVSLILLVALTPAGGEASHPLGLGIYRTLLFGILGVYYWKERPHLPRLSPLFMGGVIAVAAIMLISLLRWPGSLFESAYLFYENVLFIAAFIALSHSAIRRPAAWKHAILGAVVLINVAYIAGTLIIGKRPLLGTFVNPNYLASFVLPGLAICAATVLLAKSVRLRVAAGIAGLFLYYGIGQTFSRGATLAGLAMLGLAGVRAARRRGIPMLRIALAGTLLLALTIAVNPALVRKFLDRGQHDPYSYQRIGIWKGSLSMIAEQPFTGVGLGHFSYVAKLFIPYVDNTIGHYRRYSNIAHSEYLQYAAEIGVPGALLLFGLGGYLLLMAWRRSNQVPPENLIAQESALLAATGLCVHALVDNNWTVPVMAAGLAVISQADLLPLSGPRTVRQHPQRNWRPAMALAMLLVWMDSAVIPSIGLYFNEAGHQAHAVDDFKRAERNHRFALAVIPRHPVLLDNLGIVYLDEYMKTKKPEYLDRSEVLFIQSMEENPHLDVPAGHLESALVQRLTDNPKTDRSIHRRIAEADQHLLRANPFNPFIRKNLAEAFYNLGDHNRAREELMKAIQMEPNYVAGYLRLAEWYEEAGEMEQSAKYKNQAIKVVNFFKDTHAEDPFDRLLLGRPQAPKQQ